MDEQQHDDALGADHSPAGSGMKPCPFCGGAALYKPSNTIAYVVCCSGCGARGPDFPLPSYTSKDNWFARLRERAVTHWNMRLPPAVSPAARTKPGPNGA